MPDYLNFPSGDESARRRAGAWLMLATAAVAAAGLFAILIALARVPALGKLFPGPEFYRVALTLHVDLSQWVWFMAFAGMLWSLAAHRMPAAWDWLAFVLACAGALAMASSPLFGAALPVMSNYMPVLGGRLFLAGLLAYGLAVLIKAIFALGESAAAPSAPERAGRVGLMTAAACVLAALVLLAWSHHALSAVQNDHGYFETLFWGAGHVWQFALTTLMMICWVGRLAAAPRSVPAPRTLGTLYVLGAVPAIAALTFPLFVTPGAPGYFEVFTGLMRWTSWEVPLILGLMLIGRTWRDGLALPAGLGLSVLLFVSGLVLGSAINGQTTLVTAHYHGTVGAVTLAFMAFTYRVLPILGYYEAKPRQVRLQLALYGWGILLMMAGLAGAGLMGAPRKAPGNLGLEMNVETFSRLLLGIGGTLATVGILMFAILIAVRLRFSAGIPKACMP